MNTEIRIRAFRAPEDIETCHKFITGHRKVLENHGINKVTSSNEEWVKNEKVFVIIVETIDGGKLYGGARIHVADEKNILPIEDATLSMDPNIRPLISRYAENGAGELCGLWNSIEVAGFGIGSLFPIRAAIVISEQIGIKSLFFLCSPLTLRFNKWVGSRIITEIGNNGTFYYPKLDLLATAVVLENAITLEYAHPREKQKIFYMRNHLSYVREEISPFKNALVKVHYELELKKVEANKYKYDGENITSL